MNTHDDPTPSSRRGDALSRRLQAARSVGYYTLIPTLLGVGPLLGFFLGSWLERRYGHEPWLTLGGVFLGGAAAVRQVIQIFKRAGLSGGGSNRPGSRNPDR